MTLWVRLLILAGIASALLGAGAYWEHGRMQTKLDAQIEKHNRFVGGVEAVGRQAKIDAEKQRLADIKAKERADENHDLRVAVLNGTIAKLRAERTERNSRGGFVPGAAPGPLSLKFSCYDSAKLDDALRKLDLGVQGLVAEGDQGIAGLSVAKEWAQRK